jgi:erythromycin esterase
MKRRFLTTAARAALGAIFLVYSAVGHCGEDGFAKWAATHAVPLTTVESASNDSDLLPLESAIGTARVVALGEPMHGAREPLAFRNRLIRFLVERMGFTAIALESGFTESISARPFIERGEGDAEAATLTGLGRGLARYPQSRELIQWMRDYNATAASAGHRRISLYGIDIPNGGRRDGPWLAMDSALTFLARADPTAANKIRVSLGDSLSGLDASQFGPLPADARVKFDRSIEAIAKAMQKNRKSLIASSSDEDYRWAVHNLDAARQLAKCLAITPPPGAGMSPWVRTMTCRDSAMAENVEWALKNEGRQGRLLVFGHDGHVMSTREDGRRMANIKEKPLSMGLPLRREYGKDLYIIAMVCATTSGDIITSKPLEAGSIESTLASVGMPLMFLDARMARQNQDALPWLSTRRSIDANVSAQFLITLTTAVDAFVFVNVLTPAVSK